MRKDASLKVPQSKNKTTGTKLRQAEFITYVIASVLLTPTIIYYIALCYLHYLLFNFYI